MCYVQLRSGLLSSFFSLTESEILEQGSREIAREEPNNGLQTSAVIDVILSWNLKWTVRVLKVFTLS